MLYYPNNPDKSFVKRVIAEEGRPSGSSTARCIVNDVLVDDSFVPDRVSQPRRLRPGGGPGGLLLRHGRSPEQQLRQPPLGIRPEEVHHRPGAAALVAGPDALVFKHVWHHVPATRDARSCSTLARRRPRSRPRSLPQPGGGRGEAVVRLRHRRGQHDLGRLPLPHRLGLERHGAGRRRASPASRPTRPSLRPPQVRDAGGRRDLRLSAAGGDRSRADRDRRGCDRAARPSQPLELRGHGGDHDRSTCWSSATRRRRGGRSSSELLLADAMHTQSDVLTSCAVLLSLARGGLGYPMLDPVGGLVIAAFIARTGLAGRAATRRTSWPTASRWTRPTSGRS